MTPKEIKPKVINIKKAVQGLTKKKILKIAGDLEANYHKFKQKQSCCGKGIKNRIIDALNFKDKKATYSADDWNNWAGYHDGTWNKFEGEKKISDPDDACWNKANPKIKPPKGDVKQDVVWIDQKRREGSNDKGFNVTYKDGLIGGFDPKVGDPDNKISIVLGIPLDGPCKEKCCKSNKTKCCKCLIWVTQKMDMYLECIDCKGCKFSVESGSKSHGLWTVKKKHKHKCRH